MTESEEMYLVTIARLKETGVESPIPLSTLAAEMDVLPVSANQMIRKLEECGLVVYIPYRGVDLTPEGNQKALKTLRLRRLWEVFLVERLKVHPEEANNLACKMEHIIPDEAAERLALFLGNPVLSPRGEPIPSSDNLNGMAADIPLAALQAGRTGQISRIQTDSACRSFLNAQGVSAGEEVRMIACSSNGAALVSTRQHVNLNLDGDLAGSLWVYPKE
jgi:DtxR family Mn-dependent transcriptional regulator